jgi:hypothetical protein
MTEPRDKRRTRKTGPSEPAVQTVTGTAEERQWSREPRPLLPPLKVGREWDRVRRIAYL